MLRSPEFPTKLWTPGDYGIKVTPDSLSSYVLFIVPGALPTTLNALHNHPTYLVDKSHTIISRTGVPDSNFKLIPDKNGDQIFLTTPNNSTNGVFQQRSIEGEMILVLSGNNFTTVLLELSDNSWDTIQMHFNPDFLVSGSQNRGGIKRDFNMFKNRILIEKFEKYSWIK